MNMKMKISGLLIDEWEKYRIIQDRIYKSDFDLFLEDVKKLK